MKFNEVDQEWEYQLEQTVAEQVINFCYLSEVRVKCWGRGGCYKVDAFSVARYFQTKRGRGSGGSEGGEAEGGRTGRG